MDQRPILENGQDQGDADTVVGTERRLVGDQPAVTTKRPDRVAGKIVRCGPVVLPILLANHIEVSLQNDSGRVLHAGAGRLADQQVARRIDLRRQSPGQRPLPQMVAQRPFRLRLAWNAAERREVLPDGCRLQVGEDRVDTGLRHVVHGSWTDGWTGWLDEAATRRKPRCCRRVEVKMLPCPSSERYS